MFKETAKRFKATAPLLLQSALFRQARISTIRVGNSVHGHRYFNVSCILNAKVLPRKKPRVKVDIPGLERITYADRMHFVPGLAKPFFPVWERDWNDPSHFYSSKLEEMPLHKEKQCFIFSQSTNPLEGVRQALWLTKSNLTKGLPDQVLSLVNNKANQMENLDDRVQNAIRHACLWDTTEEEPSREKYCGTLVRNLLHLCGSLQATHPGLGRRIFAEKYSLAATWSRGDELFQVRGKNGLLLNSMDPLPVVAGKEEIQNTADHILETFYPISPTIDLQRVHVYKELSHTGFKDDYPYPHAHTLFILRAGDTLVNLPPEQLRAKMIMFAFGNALTRAQTLHGTKAGVLEEPIVVQSVATDGQMFQFVVFQLNTTDLQPDEGVKNMVWIDEDQLLYDSAIVCPVLKRKVVHIPAGLSGYKSETFQKLMALYLHGAV
ncbi:39S ribosomal protein L37, mitochondrial isoform X1 [Esox lucius]|uniref:Large ribosomal subunit protein mL37 n=2 Tax=Esox lucius TaxID=8010 RepID=A0AAY5K891_ESOLU|nr:39S ribosomal protein L37, mitochondrial isoform X1 [Esox lucius]